MSSSCDGYQKWELSRRQMLKAATVGAAVSWLAPSSISQIAASPVKSSDHTFIEVFLRGGADGLNMVVPYEDDHYHRARPTLRIKEPAKKDSDSAIDLDGFFGLHPKLSGIHNLFTEGTLAIVHAVGSQDQTRSHFEAMNAMDRGLASSRAGDASGWLARYLSTIPRNSPLRAVSFSGVLPDSLRGGTSAMNLQSLTDYRLDSSDKEFLSKLKSAYEEGDDDIQLAGRETLRLLELLNSLNYANYKPSGNADYPDSDLGNGLRQAAFLVKGKIGVEVIALDTYGWDTHVTQGAGVGWQAGLIEHVATCLSNFTKDMGKDMSKVTVVVKTEFGRRVYENGGFGTDHGRGSCMFVLGGSVKGGKVYGKWPGLAPENLEGTGDLAVTTDYRSILSEVMVKKMDVLDTSPIFGEQRLQHLNVLG